MKQFKSKKTRLLRFDKILVIQPIAEVYGESHERQLCSEIGLDHYLPLDGMINIQVYPSSLRMLGTTQLCFFFPDHIKFNDAGYMKHAYTRQSITNNNNNNKRK